MRYEKPWLSYEEQSDRLIERGLLCDREELITHLVNVGYYRLSGYLYIFKSSSATDDEEAASDGERFVPGTSLQKVWDLYTFDRQLRLLVLDAIERIEVYMRTQLAYLLGESSGAFGYLDKSSLSDMGYRTYEKFMRRCFGAYDRSKAQFIKHFKDKYGDVHELPPYWTLVNIMDFGLIAVLGYMLDHIAPDTSWHDKMKSLLQGREEDDLRRMGFGEGWRECPMLHRLA